MWQNSEFDKTKIVEKNAKTQSGTPLKTKNVTKLEKIILNKTQKHELEPNSTQNLRIFKKVNCDKIQQLKWWQNSITQIVTKLKKK